MRPQNTKPLYSKLGIKRFERVSVINMPESYFDWLGGCPDGVHFEFSLKTTEDADLIHLFVQKRSDLKRLITISLKKIHKDGTIWVSWPKKASKLGSEVDDHDVRDVALPLGLVDNKICSVSEDWAAIKLVFRLSERRKVN